MKQQQVLKKGTCEELELFCTSDGALKQAILTKGVKRENLTTHGAKLQGNKFLMSAEPLYLNMS